MAVQHRPHPTDDPTAVLTVFQRHRVVHPYGIFDVANLWDRSRWWVRGEAAVGLIALPGSEFPVVYAVSAVADARTLDLLGDLEPQLPSRLIITGPEGLTDRLAGAYRALWSGPHVKMHLARPESLPRPDAEVRVLTATDLPRLERLFAVDRQSGVYFHAGLLDSGHYVGIDHDGALVAAAGIHLVDRRHRVTALGNVSTHPRRRRRGLASRVVATLCHRLLGEVDVIGLNVRRDNVPARALYERLGFVSVAAYEEAELARRS
jgi:ribosomal protein S18 acetylase RimI-like enzyme